MQDYKKMYITLLQETAKAIAILQKAQQDTEDIYITDHPSNHLGIINSDDRADDSL